MPDLPDWRTSIRALRKSDEDIVYEHLMTCFSEYARDDAAYFSVNWQSRSEVEERAFPREGCSIGAFEGRKLIGFAAIQVPSAVTYHELLMGKDVSVMELLSVAPSMRVGGVGKALVQECLALAQHSGVRFLRWDCPERATSPNALYNSIGASLLRREDYGHPYGMFNIYSMSC